MKPSALEALIAALQHPHAPISPHTRQRARDLHVADSLVALELEEVRTATVLADLGSGAGLPALPLAASLPEATVYAVESVGRKADFIESTAASMGLTNVLVVTARAEEWTEGAGRCDVVTARALGPLPVLVEYAAPLLRAGGLLVAWKGEVPDLERRDGEAAALIVGLVPAGVRPVEPFAGSVRHTLHLFRKVKPTPPGFPRRAGIATKRPLRANT